MVGSTKMNGERVKSVKSRLADVKFKTFTVCIVHIRSYSNAIPFSYLINFHLFFLFISCDKLHSSQMDIGDNVRRSTNFLINKTLAGKQKML